MQFIIYLWIISRSLFHTHTRTLSARPLFTHSCCLARTLVNCFLQLTIAGDIIKIYLYIYIYILSTATTKGQQTSLCMSKAANYLRFVLLLLFFSLLCIVSASASAAACASAAAAASAAANCSQCNCFLSFARNLRYLLPPPIPISTPATPLPPPCSCYHVPVDKSSLSHCGMGREPSFFSSFTSAVLWFK